MNTNFKITSIILCALTLITAPIYAQSNIKNAAKSALIPGWGELSLGNDTGYIFLAGEAALWASRFYFEKESDLKIRQSKQFAYNNANMSTYDVSPEIWALMERYNSSGFEIGGYNEYILTEAYRRHPNNPAERTKYIDENKLPDDIHWDWGDRDTRGQYQIFIKHSLNNSDYAKVIGGTIMANHIISFLNAIRVGNKTKNIQIYTNFDHELTPYLNCLIKF